MFYETRSKANPLWLTRGLWLACHSDFKLDRREMMKPPLSSTGVVKGFNVLKKATFASV